MYALGGRPSAESASAFRRAKAEAAVQRGGDPGVHDRRTPGSGSAGGGQMGEDDDVAGVARPAVEKATTGEYPQLRAPARPVHLLVGKFGLVEDLDPVHGVDGGSAVGPPGLDVASGVHLREGG